MLLKITAFLCMTALRVHEAVRGAEPTTASSLISSSTSSLSSLATPAGHTNLTIEELVLSIRNDLDPSMTRRLFPRRIFRGGHYHYFIKHWQPASTGGGSLPSSQRKPGSMTTVNLTAYDFRRPVIKPETAVYVTPIMFSKASPGTSVAIDVVTATTVPHAPTGTQESSTSSSWDAPDHFAAGASTHDASALTSTVKSSGAPRVRPKVMFVWSLVLAAASITFSRPAKSRRSSITETEDKPATTSITTQLRTKEGTSFSQESNSKGSDPVSAITSKSPRPPSRSDTGAVAGEKARRPD